MSENTRLQKMEATKQELFRALQSRYSLQYYLKVVHEATGLQLTLCDTSFGVLATAPDGGVEDPENVETINGRQYITVEATQQMDQYRHTEHILENRKPYVCQDPKFPYDIAFEAVRINRAVVAYIFSPGRAEGFREEDLELLDYLGQILSIEMQKNEAFQVENGLKYEYYLQELIDGHFSSDQFAERRLQQLKCKPQPYYFMVYFTFDGPESRHAASDYYYQQILNIFPECVVGLVRSHLYMLLPRSTPRAFEEKEALALTNFLQFNKMRCGVSYYYTSLTASDYAVDHAMAAVRCSNQQGRILHYEDAYLNHLFSLGKNRSWLTLQICPDLRMLANYDEEHHTELLQTLRTFIECSRSASAASAALHIHKSTFFYRMGKIAELLNTDIYDGKRLFAYEFSLKLIDYLRQGDQGTKWIPETPPLDKRRKK